MKDFLIESNLFGFVLTLIIFNIAVLLKSKIKNTFFHPLLISTILIILILLLFKINYETYNNSAKYISYFLTPTTVCLVVPLYKQIKVLKKDILAIILGIFSGVIANEFVIVLFVKIFNLKKEIGTSLLAKSITTPIAIGVTEELGGITPITVFAVILSGLIGAVIAPKIFKIFKIKESVSKGLACGTASHGSGTTTALELGEVEGAMSGLAIAITGIITTIIAPIVNFIFFK